ncbi:S-adenosyl-L-methionine-dependent methyltransferase [Synechococcus sp. WH 8101]|uniref:class I SAM-dependent methyltransferase n=1 Tax=Synechococcus sp. WH 8101 TaxID=59932 RepID=UPI001023AB98|nr:class I SAM-dependent methyltransferase [Synechococcus sp. WH 8101]QNI44358.1 S-adenosyl-L-methionine-dependent methyltransferase [Synechococcus sp. WH 8101]
MEDYQLLIDLHKKGYRQGPGGDSETELAIKLSGLDTAGSLNVLDVGCGTGASTIALASRLDCQVTGIDIFDEFLVEVIHKSNEKGLDSKIRTRNCPMEDLPFAKEEFDVIWGEGSIYNMGFGKGISYLRDFLKPNGILAVSEITWFSKERPKELEDYWNLEYPEIATASEKMGILESNGFSIMGYFPLPKKCWEENYYAPMRSRFSEFLRHNEHSEMAREIVDSEEKEMELFSTFHQYYGYGFYIAKKL